MGKSKRSNPKSAPKALAKQDEKILPWTTITHKQADQFVQITTTGAWVSIGILVLFWVTVRFIGPALNLWTLADSP